MNSLVLRLVLLAPALLPVMGHACLLGQKPDSWNSPHALALVQRAREVRQEVRIDSAFVGYTGSARGYVYFYFDRTDSEQRNLVKTDQVALRVHWKAPHFTKQEIIGLRDAKALPTNIRYHLDHLTVVQNEFDDQIRMGDGDEVAAVLHPAALGSESTYDFRLVDSLTVTLPGPVEPVRVYEIQVRPKNPETPAIIGSVFVDRATAAIVRMRFTFTPSSYVDPYLDYIRVSLDNGLWQGRYWLPHRQEAEIRRELPLLDFLAGSVIRGRFEIGDYVFNPDFSSDFFSGRRVVSVPEEVREAFPFEDELYAELEDEGLTRPPELEDIRSDAARMVGQHYLSGLSRLRLHLPSTSSGLRYNRAEGITVAAGVTIIEAFGPVNLRALGGLAQGRGKPTASLVLSSQRVPGAQITASWHALRDIGQAGGSSGVVSSLGALLVEEDYLDPYFGSGVGLSHSRPIGQAARLSLAVLWERQELANDVISDDGTSPDFRSVRGIEEGDLWGAKANLVLGQATQGPHADVSVQAATLNGSQYSIAMAKLSWRARWSTRVGEPALDISAESGLATAGAPPQALFLLGGRGTIPGYSYRSFSGNRFWLMQVNGSRDLLAPWVRVNLFGALAGTGLGGSGLPTEWGAAATRGALASVGAGLGLGWDVIGLSLARGLTSEAEWEFIFSVSRRFWEWL